MTAETFYPDTATLSWVADRLDASAANTQIVRWLREAVKTEELRPAPNPPADDVREALAKAWDEGARSAGSYCHEDTWTHEMTPYSQNPYRGEARS